LTETYYFDRTKYVAKFLKISIIY